MAGAWKHPVETGNNRADMNFKPSSLLKRLSHIGMEYGDMVLKNSRAIGVTEFTNGYFLDPFGRSQSDYQLEGSDYNLFAELSLPDVGSRKNIGMHDLNYDEGKRDSLRAYSMEDEIEDILEKLCDESIVYDQNNYFALPVLTTTKGGLELKDEEGVREKLQIRYRQLYRLFGFLDENAAWGYFRKWLVDGFISFEIIYDNVDGRQKNIIGFKELDALSLEPSVDRDGNKVWIQYKGYHARERLLLDSQVIYISWSTIGTPQRASYTERLIRSFNLLRIMEHSRIIWAVVNSSFKTMFIIPVGGKSKNRAKQSINSLIQRYREVVEFNNSSGELTVNGKSMLPFNKEYWIPETESGTPTIDTIGGDGPDLSDTDSVKYFRERFYKNTKIPLSRFDTESPPNWEINAESITRDEIQFARFIGRIRSIWKEIILKPLIIQITLDYPTFKKDTTFKESIGLEFQKYNQFEEMKDNQLWKERVEIVELLKDSLVDMDENGLEIKFFPNEYLVRKFLKIGDAEMKVIKTMKAKEDAVRAEGVDPDAIEDIKDTEFSF